MSTYVGYGASSIVGVKTGNVYPDGGVVGELFYNTSTQNVAIWNGTLWSSISGEVPMASDTDFPVSGLVGQLFYNMATEQVYVSDGADWFPVNRIRSGTTNPLTATVGEIFYNTTDDYMYVWDGSAWNSSSMRGYTGSRGIQGPLGYTGSKGDDGTSVTILGSFADPGDLPVSGALGDGYLIAGDLYVWNGSAWVNVGQIQGPQGVQGFTGSGGLGYTGSAGIGFTGSAGIGFTGSRGATGFTGSAGTDGELGYTGSRGFTGSQGDTGFVGSRGLVGSFGYTGSRGVPGPSYIPNGGAGLPHETWSDMGIVGIDATTIALRVAGANPFRVSSTAVLADIPVRAAAGTEAAPAYSFINRTNTGVYLAGTVLKIVNAGERISISDTTVTIPTLTSTTITADNIAGNCAQTSYMDITANRLLRFGAFGLGSRTEDSTFLLAGFNIINRARFARWDTTTSQRPVDGGNGPAIYLPNNGQSGLWLAADTSGSSPRSSLKLFAKWSTGPAADTLAWSGWDAILSGDDNLASLSSASTARTNLGLGAIATRDDITINQMADSAKVTSSDGLENYYLSDLRFPTARAVADYVKSSAVGMNQTWQTPSRSSGTVYTNTTGYPITIAVTLTYSSNLEVSANGSTWITVAESSGSEQDRRNTATIIVPAGWRYRLNGSRTLWKELR